MADNSCRRYVPNTGNHEQHEGRGGDHPGDVSGLYMVTVSATISSGRWGEGSFTHIVEDVEVPGQRVSAGHDGAIVGDRHDGKE